MSKFKKGDKVRVVADEEKLEECYISSSLTNVLGIIKGTCGGDYRGSSCSYLVTFDGKCDYFLPEDGLELAEEQPTATTFVGHPDGGLEMVTDLMTLERFDKLVDYIVEKRVKAVMCAKSAEYAKGKDKLHNFKRAGTMNGISPMEACRGMKLKHEVSLVDMLDGLRDGKEYSRELWEEKFTDDINYRILQWAILAEQYGWKADRTTPTEGGH